MEKQVKRVSIEWRVIAAGLAIVAIWWATFEFNPRAAHDIRSTIILDTPMPVTPTAIVPTKGPYDDLQYGPREDGSYGEVTPVATATSGAPLYVK